MQLLAVQPGERGAWAMGASGSPAPGLKAKGRAFGFMALSAVRARGPVLVLTWLLVLLRTCMY